MIEMWVKFNCDWLEESEMKIMYPFIYKINCLELYEHIVDGIAGYTIYGMIDKEMEDATIFITDDKELAVKVVKELEEALCKGHNFFDLTRF
jgi:hypothetical protein